MARSERRSGPLSSAGRSTLVLQLPAQLSARSSESQPASASSTSLLRKHQQGSDELEGFSSSRRLKALSPRSDPGSAQASGIGSYCGGGRGTPPHAFTIASPILASVRFPSLSTIQRVSLFSFVRMHATILLRKYQSEHSVRT